MQITVDGMSIEAQSGDTVLDAARRAGIEIPTLCHLPGRPAQASCFLCMVKIQGGRRLVPACGTVVSEGMVVENDSAEVLDARRTAIELLLSDHLGDCIGPCQGVCPAHMNIPRMIQQIADGQDREALITVKEMIALPAVLGRICPELCEKGCRRASYDGAVSVCRLKRYVADEDLVSSDPYLPEKTSASGGRVAIVGTGPAGLAAAYYLLQLGHSVELYEEHDLPGGNLRYAVPEDSLPREVLDAEIAVIERLGAVFHCGVRIGQQIGLESLREAYDAVLLAVGEVKSGFELEFSRQGIRVDKTTFQTSLDGVFSAGAAVLPTRHAVRSCADGRSAAYSIHHYLAGRRSREAKGFSCHIGKLDSEEVKPFASVASDAARTELEGTAGFTTEEARREALRCLHCECRGADTCALRQYAAQFDANPLRYRLERRPFDLDDSHSEILFEPGKCIACGICVRIAAEAGEELGLAFTGRGFPVRVTSPLGRKVGEGLRTAARACALACPTGALTVR